MEPIISFDVDGTLVNPDFNGLIWFDVVPELYARKRKIKLEEAKKKVFQEYDKIGDNDARWYTLDFWLDYLDLGVKPEELLQKYARAVSLYSDVLPTLSNLGGKYTLIVCSGMSREFIDIKLKKESIFQYFSRIFSAVSNFGLTKKESYFYEKLCQQLNVKPSHLIHVGDNYELDYLVPKKIGIKVFYLDRTNNTPEKKGTISSLQELIERL